MFVYVDTLTQLDTKAETAAVASNTDNSSTFRNTVLKGKFLYRILRTAQENLLPDRPVQSNVISTSLCSINPHKYCPLTGHKLSYLRIQDICRAQWLMGRASDSRLRKPGFESCAAVLKHWASFFTLHCSGSRLLVHISTTVYSQVH